MADKRAYFKLDVGYLTNPKVAAVASESTSAVLLHLQCIAYSAQHLTDGMVPMRLAMRLACAEQCDVDLLVEYGLLRRVNSHTIEVHDYLEHQRSAAEANKAADQAKRAAGARWAAAERDAAGNASSMPTAMPKREERDNNTSSPSEIDSDFEAWYSNYPKKVGKQGAIKAYRKARKSVSAEDLVNGLAAQLPRMLTSERRFIANPATWLNDGRWEDEVETVEQVDAEDGYFAPFTLPECPPDIADDPVRYQRWVDEQRQAWSR